MILNIHLFYFEFEYILTLFETTLIDLCFLALFFYSFGILGIIYTQKNLLILLLYVEMSYVGVFGLFLLASLYLNSPLGQIYALILLILIACESVIGLGLLLIFYKIEKNANIENFKRLRG